ncbi:hypothetical protein SADUNF_Sadunf05G0128100 [Salix dunnii]|uniref:Uncharacterized protein n=1 Tax=Salix dunnii TaxID=1413687 RepID=A0A835K603_9ROSI|nr:hypothetical protein SADUNF_Sadunf05G0128100 [Salix dunnii]
MPMEEYFQKALYTFDIGQNDLGARFFGNKSIEEVNSSVPNIVHTFLIDVNSIYDLGARSFWIHNTGPIGCLVYILANFLSAEKDSVGYAKSYNEVAQYFNHELKKTVLQLRKDFPLAAFTYVDVYSVKYSLFSEPQKHVRVVWDGVHYTEAANKLFFERISTGAFSDPPIPLNCEFPAVFNFGDSNSDTGGLVAAFPPLNSPYGETYFHMPAGSAYLDSLGTNFTVGANFAIAASTITLPTKIIPANNGFSPFFFLVQYTQFVQLKARSQLIRKQGGVFAQLMPKEEYFEKALYTFDIGQNDLGAGFFGNKSIEEVNSSVPNIVNTFLTDVKIIYNLGARSFWIHNTGPIGCLGYILANFPSSEKDSAGCAKSYNEVAQYFNHELKETILQLRKDFPSAAFTYVDVYSVKYSLFSEPQKHGFKLPLVACCGYGGLYNYNSNAGCGSTITVNGTQIIVGSCDDPSVRVVWDGIHYTEAANKFVFERISTGAFSDPPVPLNLACHRTLGWNTTPDIFHSITYLDSLGTNFTIEANFTTAASTITLPFKFIPFNNRLSPFFFLVQHTQFVRGIGANQMETSTTKSRKTNAILNLLSHAGGEVLRWKADYRFHRAYLDSLGTNFTVGANFATAASTITLPTTVIPANNGFSPFYLRVQYNQFEQLKARSQLIRKQGGVFAQLMPMEEYFHKALYTFDIGQNDLGAGFFGNKSIEEVNASVPNIVNTFLTNVTSIYNLGARSFWIHNTGPIGCLGYILDNFPSAEKDSVGCAKSYNEVAQYFNHELKEIVLQLRKDFPSAAFTYVDVYSVKYSLFSDPQKQVRVVWDGVHYTEAANKFVFEQISTGAFSDPPVPLNLACHRTLDVHVEIDHKARLERSYMTAKCWRHINTIDIIPSQATSRLKIPYGALLYH